MFLSALLAATMLNAAPALIYEPGNLVAWCVVPFDAKKRGPAERAEMLQKLGFKKFAYDWRAEHLPTFEQEVIELKKRNIELTAVWFPSVLNADAKALLAVIEKHKLTPQLWVMVPDPAGKNWSEQMDEAVKQLTPVVEASAKAGCKLSLYNHGGWAGEPANAAILVMRIKRPHVGVVYNLHHGHADLPDMMLSSFGNDVPLHAINLNGTHPRGDLTGRKIEILGNGPEDLRLLRTIRDGGFRGPIGILGHTDDDAEARLADNLAGLARLRAMLDNRPVPPRQPSRTGRKQPGPELAFAADRSSLTYGPTAEFVHLSARPAGGSRLEGSATREGDFVRYTPRFKFTAGADYSVTVGRWTRADEARVTVPADRPPTTPTVVSKVEGLPDNAPQNTLRFYLHFSRPMTRGEGLKHVKLANKDGDPVDDAFLDLAEELWSADGRRLTLLFDPARVKRELAPREALGPVLEVGRGYRLTVDAAWPDENGFPLGKSFTKAFTATRPDEEPIDPAKWKVDVDADRGWMKVTFEKPLDVALADRMIRLVTAAGKPVAGNPFASDRRWFHSSGGDSLPPGEYLIRVDSRLEDPCGNRVGRAFEVNLAAPADDIPAFVDIPVTVK
jgi:hypothetical protein